MTWFLLILSIALCASASKLTHIQNMTALMQQMAVKHGQNQTSEGDDYVLAGKEPFQCNLAKDCKKSVTYVSENPEEGCIKCGGSGYQCLHVGPMVECPTSMSAVPGIDDAPDEWYVADDYEQDSHTWPNRGTTGSSLKNVGGSGSSPVKKTTSKGNGASAAITTLRGTKKTKLNFGSRPLSNNNYAMCVLSRYRQKGGRILNGGGNWLFGHWAGRAGVTHLQGWVGGSSNRFNPVTQWLYLCCSDNACNGNGKTWTGSIRAPSGGTLGVHDAGCCTGETSNFEFSELIIWRNKKLTPGQLQKAVDYFKNVLEGGPRR